MSHHLEIHRVSGFWQRLRGLMFQLSWPDDAGLLIPHCNCVHTVGMRFALDLVYLDPQGYVVKLVHGLRPWRLSWGGWRAAHTLELNAGGIERHGLRLGAHHPSVLTAESTTSPAGHTTESLGHKPQPPRRDLRGAAMVEFVIVAPLISVLGFGVMHYSLLFFAKGQINHATFMAARAGSVNHGRLDAMQEAYVQALVPLYGGGRDRSELTQSLRRARCDLAQGDTGCQNDLGPMWRLEVINPTQESFADFARDTSLNQRFGSDAQAIPNTGIALRPDLTTVQNASGQSLADANLLKIRVTQGYEPKVWLLGMIYKKYLQWLDPGTDDFHTQLVEAGRLPIVSHATVLMQSEAVLRGSASDGVYASNPGLGNNGQALNPGDPPLSDRNPPQCLTMGCSVAPDVPSGPHPGQSPGGDNAGQGGGFCSQT